MRLSDRRYCGLAVSVVLVLSNPTMDEYLGFVQGELTKAMDRMEQTNARARGAMVEMIFRRHSQELLKSMVVLTPCVKIGECSAI